MAEFGQQIKKTFKEVEIDWWNPNENNVRYTCNMEIILSILKDPKIKDVLDVGVGRGKLIVLLLQQVKNVIGIDINKKMLNFCKNRVKKMGFSNFMLIEMDAEKLGFLDNTFDASVCNNSIVVFPNPEKAIRELIRVTKPKGKIIFDVYNKNSLYGLMLSLCKRLKSDDHTPIRGKKTILNYFTLNFISKLVRSYDVQVNKMYGIPMIPDRITRLFGVKVQKLNQLLSEHFPSLCHRVVIELEKCE